MLKTDGILWVTTTTVVPSCLQAFSSRSHITVDEYSSRLPVGSSANIRCGFFDNARATPTLCCSPPDSSRGYFSSLPISLTWCRSFFDCALPGILPLSYPRQIHKWERTNISSQHSHSFINLIILETLMA